MKELSSAMLQAIEKDPESLSFQDWIMLSFRYKLPSEFIRNNSQFLIWDIISRRQNLDEQLIYDFIDYVCFDNLKKNKNIDQSLIYRVKDKFISRNKKFPVLLWKVLSKKS